MGFWGWWLLAVSYWLLAWPEPAEAVDDFEEAFEVGEEQEEERGEEGEGDCRFLIFDFRLRLGCRGVKSVEGVYVCTFVRHK